MDKISFQSFIAVAEEKSFTKAAEKVGRTQSAISQQIRRIEELLGKKLLSRDKNLALTADGEVFLSYARQLFTLFVELETRFKQPELEGEVHFGVPEDFASVYLSDVLSQFIKTHPRVLLNVECDLTLNLFERFKKQDFDLVLVKMARPEDFPNGIEVWTEELEWVGADSNVDMSRPIPLVLSPSPCVYRAHAIESLERSGVKWHPVFTSSSYTSTIAAVRAGMGLTVLPRAMMPKDLKIAARGFLPKLNEMHVSLLKHDRDNSVISSLEGFVLSKLG